MILISQNPVSNSINGGVFVQSGAMVRPIGEELFEFTLETGERMWVHILGCSERQFALDRDIYRYLANHNKAVALPRKEKDFSTENFRFLDRKSLCYWPTPGQKADFFSETHQQCGAEFLANFHQILKRYRPEVLPHNTLGKLIFLWERRLLRLAEFRRVAEFRESPGVFDKLYLDNYAEVLGQVKNALKKLGESDYLSLCGKEGQICMARFRSDRFRFTHGQLLAWDFSLCRWDLPVVDLYRFLLYLCRHCGYNRDMINRVLDTYESIRPMEEHERSLMEVLFGFPDRLYRIISDYFLSGSGKSLRRQMQRFCKELYQNDDRLEVFDYKKELTT